jgi:hypothetical protein
MAQVRTKNIEARPLLVAKIGSADPACRKIAQRWRAPRLPKKHGGEHFIPVQTIATGHRRILAEKWSASPVKENCNET